MSISPARSSSKELKSSGEKLMEKCVFVQIRRTNRTSYGHSEIAKEGKSKSQLNRPPKIVII